MPLIERLQSLSLCSGKKSLNTSQIYLHIKLLCKVKAIEKAMMQHKCIIGDILHLSIWMNSNKSIVFPTTLLSVAALYKYGNSSGSRCGWTLQYTGIEGATIWKPACRSSKMQYWRNKYLISKNKKELARSWECTRWGDKGRRGSMGTEREIEEEREEEREWERAR